MTDAAATPPAAPVPDTPTSSGAPPAPPAASRPEWLPDTVWDAEANSVKFDALEPIVKFHQTETERRAALPKAPEEYKVTLPADFKVPDGIKPEQIKTNENDPLVPLLRTFAHETGASQEQVSKVVAAYTQMQIDAHVAENARVAEETKKLGDKASDRIAAVGTWGKGLKDRGEITEAEFAEIGVVTQTAAGVMLLEKLISKANGSVPATTPAPRPAAPAPKTLAEAMWPTMPQTAKG